MTLDTGIYISGGKLAALPDDLRGRLLNELFGTTVVPVALPQPAADDVFLPKSVVVFSTAEAKALVTNVNPKTLKVLTAIAGFDSPKFDVADIAAATGFAPSELSGVWSGITQRVRHITQSKDAILIDWYGQPKHDADGRYIGQLAQMAPATHAAMQKVLAS